MNERAFIDTNILIYSVSDDPKKSEEARNFFRSDNEFHISFQIVGEFASACQRKKIITQQEIEKTVEEYFTDFHIQLISDSTIRSAFELQSKHLFSYWDALIVATALESNCNVLITEDLQNGLIIEKTLKVQNPFLESSLSFH